GLAVTKGLARTKGVMRIGDVAAVMGVALLAIPGRPLAVALAGAVILGAGVGLPYAPVFNTAAASLRRAPGAAQGLAASGGTGGASGDGMSFPRSFVTLKVGERSACAAVAPRQTITCGLRMAISASSHKRHAAISLRLGFSWSRRFPAARHLKCFTAFVTYTV